MALVDKIFIAAALLAPVTLSGCSEPEADRHESREAGEHGGEGRGEGRGEHSREGRGEGRGEHSRERRGEGRGEHGGEGRGEHGQESSGEESGEEFGLNDRYDRTRNGVRLVLAYDASANSFQGTVKNTTDATLKRVRVEVHLSNGIELGPTAPGDLGPGEERAVKLAAKKKGFERWSAHPEVGSGEHGGEGGHDEKGRGEHKNKKK